MDIINKSGRPLNVPLPGGKKLFLGPGKAGQVSAKMLLHPPLAKLIEDGALETGEADGKRSQSSGRTTFGQTTGQRQGGGGVARKSGDR